MNINLIKSLIVALALAGLAPACGQAKYDIVNKPGETANPNPNEFGNDDQTGERAAASFYFEATPGTAYPNETISFKGVCAAKIRYHIEWIFGDKSTDKTGNTSSHPYAKPGTYTVKGTCVLEDGRKLQASTKITILSPSDPENRRDPGQRPIQTSPVQNI